MDHAWPAAYPARRDRPCTRPDQFAATGFRQRDFAGRAGEPIHSVAELGRKIPALKRQVDEQVSSILTGMN